MRNRKALKLALGVPVAALFLWLTLRQIEPSAIISAFQDLTLGWLAGALMSVMLGHACRIERWRLMLASTNHRIRWRDCAGPLLASFACNNVLPFRAGDVMRTFAFSASLGASSGAVAVTVFVERMLDLLTLLAQFGLMLALVDIDIAGLAGMSGMVLLAIAFAVLLILLFPGAMSPLVLLIGGCVAHRLPRFGKRIADEVEKSLATLRHLADARRMAVLFLWSLAVWVAEGCAFWLAALAFPSIIQPLSVWLAMPVGTLATLLPSTPGYVGTFDYFTVQAMTVLGNSVSSATAYAFVIHAMLWLPPTLVGGLYLVFRPIRMNAIAR